jgi:hypothetical protein
MSMIPSFTTDEKTGTVYLNNLRRFVRGGLLVPSAANALITTPARVGTNPGMSTSFFLEGPQDGKSVLHSLTGVHSSGVLQDVRDRLSVEFTEMAWRRTMMNRPIPTNHVFGTNIKPFFLKESVLLDQYQTLKVQFSNNSLLGASSFRIAGEITKFQAEMFKRPDVANEFASQRARKLFYQNYWLTTDQPISMAASGTATGQFILTGDIYFCAMYQLGHVIYDAAGATGDTQEIVEIELFDAKTGRALQNQPFTLNTGLGTAENPYIFPHPIIIEPQTNLKVNYRNLLTNKALEVFHTLYGVAVYTGRAGLTEKSILQEAQVVFQAKAGSVEANTQK